MRQKSVSTPSRILSGAGVLGRICLLVVTGPAVFQAWPDGVAAQLLGIVMAIAFLRNLLESLHRALWGTEIWEAAS